jgi:hypothetical protein
MGPRKATVKKKSTTGRQTSNAFKKDFTTKHGAIKGLVWGIAASETYAFLACLIVLHGDLAYLAGSSWIEVALAFLTAFSVAQFATGIVGGLGGFVLGGLLTERILDLKVRTPAAGNWLAACVSLWAVTPIHVAASGLEAQTFLAYFFFPAAILVFVAFLAVNVSLRRVPKGYPKGALAVAKLRRITIALATIEAIALVAVVAKNI